MKLKLEQNKTQDKMEDNKLAFGKSNYVWMAIGLAVILLGFVFMANDSEQYGFGFMGLTLGPITVFAGFMLEIFAIFKKK